VAEQPPIHHQSLGDFSRPVLAVASKPASALASCEAADLHSRITREIENMRFQHNPKSESIPAMSKITAHNKIKLMYQMKRNIMWYSHYLKYTLKRP
jgi:hypothetical protein